MKADQYSRSESVKVKARANYRCEFCGSDQLVQAHAPGGDHSEWRRGRCLCASCHADQHPDMPRSLFFTEMQQPYWPNTSARALALEFGCHNRTIIRAAKRLQIVSGVALSEADKQRLWESVRCKGRSTIEVPREGRSADYLFTTGEVAKILKVHVNTVYNQIRANELKAYKVVHKWRVTLENLERFARGERKI